MRYLHKILFCLLFISPCCIQTRAGPPDGASNLVWGSPANSLYPALTWGMSGSDKAPTQSLKVLVWTAKTNVALDYYSAPLRQLEEIELKNPRGNPLPLRIESLTAFLPSKIRAKDWPHGTGRHSNLCLGTLLLDGHGAGNVASFAIQDAFQIAEGGDYTLTVQAAVYHSKGGQEDFVRVDLPAVTAKIHLSPSPK